ncbi:PREDICTED: uncharacterized protein LOC109177131 [Ipomoea nil]|uniref:uncharacterized protein LOC109177131 n=1 Tax=Ipomoea nil TaxID=35883 RepID=UPI000901695E|nr:PREDICTED: uncharacterized protein LOC109177131 [Ipomoea nil]
MAVTTGISTFTIVHLNAPTHFPIKLTTSNFPVWRRQIKSTLIGFNLDGYITGMVKASSQYLGDTQTNINPAYTLWFRQDQILFSAILGSCLDTLQPLISSAPRAHDAWKRLASSCAATSHTRGRVVSLKAKLAKNLKGSRTIIEYLRDMHAIADDLALVQSLVYDEDLTVHIITQLGDEYNAIVAAIRVRETPISLGELSDVLTDFERVLKEGDATQQVGMVTANVTTKRTSHMPSGSHNASPDQNGSFNSRTPRGGFNEQNGRTNNQGGFNGNNARSQRYC